MLNKCGLFLCLSVMLFAGVAFAGDDLSIVAAKHKETIILSVKTVTPRKVFLLPSPDRLVVDIPAAGERPDIAMPSDYKGKWISRVRFGQFDPHTWRLVFDLNQPVRVLGDEQKNGKLRIEIAAADDTQAKEDNAAAEPQNWPADGKKKIATEDYTGETKQADSKPIKHKSGKSSGKPMIVIDPGHGGVDPGTEGPDGTYEKDVVLAYAMELKSRLLKTGRYQVMLTRDDDEIVGLRKRVEIARKAGARMFISLHADSAPQEDVRGLSVYTVSEKASDQETEALAARENKADVLVGVNLADEREDVAGILISLAERETKNRSATLADLLVTALDDKVHLLSNAHRFAGFAVLKAPDVPSVLIEIGFLSHPNEEKLINSKAYRDKVTGGITAGVDDYFRQEKHMGDQ